MTARGLLSGALDIAFAILAKLFEAFVSENEEPAGLSSIAWILRDALVGITILVATFAIGKVRTLLFNDRPPFSALIIVNIVEYVLVLAFVRQLLRVLRTTLAEWRRLLRSIPKQNPDLAAHRAEFWKSLLAQYRSSFSIGVITGTLLTLLFLIVLAAEHMSEPLKLAVFIFGCACVFLGITWALYIDRTAYGMGESFSGAVVPFVLIGLPGLVVVAIVFGGKAAQYLGGVGRLLRFIFFRGLVY